MEKSNISKACWSTKEVVGDVFLTTLANYGNNCVSIVTAHCSYMADFLSLSLVCIPCYYVDFCVKKRLLHPVEVKVGNSRLDNSA